MTYDPSVGRWLSEDPIGYLGGDTNLYRYVHNSPTNATDPTGLIEEPGFWVSMIPVVGPALNVAHHLQEKNYGLAALNVALGIADLFFVGKAATALVKGIEHAGIKAVFKPGLIKVGIGKYLGEPHVWSETADQIIHALGRPGNMKVIAESLAQKAYQFEQDLLIKNIPVMSRAIYETTGHAAQRCWTAIVSQWSRANFHVAPLAARGLATNAANAANPAPQGPPPGVTIRNVTTHPSSLNFLGVPALVKLQEWDYKNTYLEGHWFSERYWRLWYKDGEVIQKVEIDKAGNEIGEPIRP